MKVTRYAAPVREQAVSALRDAIRSGELSPGARLVERELCEQFDVSRNTLREAFRQLEAEGFLDIRPYRSPMVAALSDGQSLELYEVREALEGEGIRLFTLRSTEQQKVELEKAGAALAKAILLGSPIDLLDTKDDFYEILFRGAGNASLFDMARNTYTRLAPLRMRSLSAPGRRAQSAREVMAVLTAMRTKDAEAAESVWRQHVRNAAEAAMQMSRIDGSGADIVAE